MYKSMLVVCAHGDVHNAFPGSEVYVAQADLETESLLHRL